MPREIVILECTEAKAEGKPVSRYMSTRNKKLQTERVEKKNTTPACADTRSTAKSSNMPPRKNNHHHHTSHPPAQAGNGREYCRS